MSRASRARRMAAAAAYGGGGLGLIVSACWGLLLGEAKLARRWVGPPTSTPPVPDGLADLDFEVAAFAHGPELRRGARAAVRALLHGRQA